MPNGKTIRQIADEIGVTRQAVYQKIKSNKSAVKRLQLYTFTVDSTKYYTSDGEKLIKSLFSDKQAVNKGVNVSTDSVYTPVNDFTPCKQEKNPINTAFSGNTANEAVNKGVNEGVNKFTANFTDLFTAQLTEKDKQLAEKDKQIAEKDKQLAEKDIQIARLTALLQNAQEQQAALVQTLAAEQALAAADKKQLLLQAGATVDCRHRPHRYVQRKDRPGRRRLDERHLPLRRQAVHHLPSEQRQPEAQGDRKRQDFGLLDR